MEIREVEFDNLVEIDDGYEVTLLRKKQQGEKTVSTFIVPPTLAKHVTNYIVALKHVIGENVSGPLIKGVPKSRFVN